VSRDGAIDEATLAKKAKAKKRAQARAGFLRETVRWHWISAAICLVGIILFAVTGITLNHARQIEAKPVTTNREATAPAPVIKALQAAEAELTSRGWVSYLNDLHKGRNTGPVWSWFLDIFAAGCIVFCITGLILLWMHAHARKTTWWYVGLGLFIPLVLALHFIP
jgi:hypothetical protein